MGLMHMISDDRGYSRMAESKGMSKTSRKALSRWLPELAGAATDALGAS